MDRRGVARDKAKSTEPFKQNKLPQPYPRVRALRSSGKVGEGGVAQEQPAQGTYIPLDFFLPQPHLRQQIGSCHVLSRIRAYFYTNNHDHLFCMHECHASKGS